MELTRIVHPTDLTAVSEGAFHHALKLGLAARCRLDLVHADGYGAVDTPSPEEFPQVRETLSRWGLLEKGAAKADVAEKLGLYVSKGEILAIDPERGLARMLRKEDAALVVLGTRGLTGLKRLFERSFSEQLSRTAKVPALFIPSDADGFVCAEDGAVRLRNLLIPVSATPDPAAAITAAKRLCEVLGQEPNLHLLHVGDAGSMPAIPLDLLRGADTIVRAGPVEETIVRVADEVEADVIVMATAGHKGFLDALRGSSTEEVLRKSRRALLAVPAA